MQGTTLAIGILGSILVLSLRPAYALAAYISALVWYPDYLRVSIGTIDISVGRIVVAALLLRCLCNSRMVRKFVWSRLDTWVTLSMVVYVGMYCLTNPSLQMALENRGGFLIDNWFSYIAARLILTDKGTLTSFVKVTGVVLAALAIFGVIEAYTHWQPFLPLRRFRPWRTHSGEFVARIRWGLARAAGPFSHSIMFGACFAMFLPLIWTLRYQRGYWGKLAYPLSAMAIVGAFSSMSSGSWVMLIAVIFCLVMEKYKHWTKPLFIAMLGWCVVVGIISNRPFYHVLYARANLGSGDWYQRVKLIDSAIEDFGEWWLAGYGGRDPGWGARYEGPTDTNNEFIKAGIHYGLLGIIALCAVLAAAFRGLIRADRQTADIESKSLYWSLGSALVGVIVVWQGVSFFGQMPMLFYTILGMVGSSLSFAKCATCSSGRALRTRDTDLVLST